MKKIIFTAFILLTIIISHSQTVLLEETVTQENDIKKWGKNLQHYSYFYFSFGFYVSPSEEGAAIKYGNSGASIFGYRYKYKICDYYALGADLSLDFKNYYLKDDDNKVLPDNINHDKEYFMFTSIKLEIYQRINFDKRGNALGKYLDLGGYFGYNISTQYFTRDDIDDMSYERIDVTRKRLQYIEPISYGATARIGYKTMAVFAEYRLSNIMKPYNNINGDEILFPELPRLIIGFNIGF